MKVENLNVGQVIKNYKELCAVLDIEARTGKGRILNHKEFDRYFEYEKQGQKYIITKIYDNPKDKIDNRSNNFGGNNLKYKDLLSSKELSNEFDGFYVYCHKLNNEVIYVGKGCKRRVVGSEGREYDIKQVEKEIVKRFDNEIEALKFEKELISYYKSIGQCEYNSDMYVPGSFRDKSNIRPKPKKKDKDAYRLLQELGYQFDKYKGWYI